MPIQRLPTRALSGAITTANLPPQISINSSASIGALTIDANNRITMPYQPAFSGKLATHQSGVLIMTNMALNNGSHYSTSNGKFTAPVAGMYHFILTTLEQGSTGAVRIRKNGSAVSNDGWMGLSLIHI